MREPSATDVMATFRRHGVSGEVREAVPREADEAVFVVSPEDWLAMRERELTLALQELLHRKVWVVTDAPSWRGRTQPL